MSAVLHQLPQMP